TEPPALRLPLLPYTTLFRSEEAFAIVKEYKGSHSGEHGDGISRSEFHEMMFGDRLVRAFETVKNTFDPTGLLNPGKIVRPARMRSEEHTSELQSRFDLVCRL